MQTQVAVLAGLGSADDVRKDDVRERPSEYCGIEAMPFDDDVGTRAAGRGCQEERFSAFATKVIFAEDFKKPA